MNINWKKNCILFLVGQTVSLFGSSLVQYAIMWYITLTTESGVMMTISIICGFLPTFFLAPFAGVWADRLNRKVLIIAADAMIATVTLLLAILFFLGYQAMWLLFLASAVRALGAAIQMPAVSAMIPQIVPEEHLLRINGINQSIQSLIMIVAPMAAGALLTFTGIEIVFFIDVVTAIAGISILLLAVHVPLHAKAMQKNEISYFRDLKEGFRYVGGHRFIGVFFVFCAILFFLIAPAAFLTPLQVARSFGNEVWRLTAIEIAFSVGMMAGGILMATWGGFSSRFLTMSIGGVMLSLTTIALGATTNFIAYLIAMALTGLAIPLFNTPATVMLQERVEEDYLGRVFGVMSMISSSMMPLGMLAFGPIADWIRIEWILVVTGILLLVEAFLIIGNRTLREAFRNVH